MNVCGSQILSEVVSNMVALYIKPLGAPLPDSQLRLPITPTPTGNIECTDRRASVASRCACTFDFVIPNSAAVSCGDSNSWSVDLAGRRRRVFIDCLVRDFSRRTAPFDSQSQH